MEHALKGYRKVVSYLLAVLVSLSTAASTGGIEQARTNAIRETESFNTRTGTLNVDYASYLSRNDLVFNQPITDPKQGVMVGNGKVGAQIWNVNGLTMQVSGVDASEQGFASQGLVSLRTDPGMDSKYTDFQQKLSLYNGLMTVKYDDDRTVTVMGSPGSEVLGIHVEDKRKDVRTISLDLSLWDVSSVAGGDLSGADLQSWQTFTTFADSDVIGLSRGQNDSNHFGYTLAASAEGADFTTQSVNPGTVRLNIKPSPSYTIWIACASRLNAPNHDSVTMAKNLLSSIKRAGYASTLANYENWWHNFWSKSFVQCSNSSGTADYLENAYYLFTFTIAGGAYGNYPFHFINGVYSGIHDDDSGHWSYAYWYWNQRDVYSSFYASNHADMMAVFNDLYSRNFDALKSLTRSRFGFDGIWVPETMGWNGNADGETQFTDDIFSTGAEAAQNMYNQYLYTNDENYLRNTAYPFMREVALFYINALSYDKDTGKYYMAKSNSHETYWEVKNAITDLAAIRSLFPITIAAGEQLGIDTDSGLRSQMRNILDNLAPYPLSPDGNTYLPCDPPVPETRNNENVICELVWPYSVTGIGYPDQQTAINGWNSRPFPYGNVWSPDAIQAARLGLGDQAYAGMIQMLSQYQNYPNGRTTNTNGEFEYMGVHLTAMNESLLQSYNGIIRVFPAVPKNDITFSSKFTLLAAGGFLVSSEYENGTVKYIGIRSNYGKTATVANPWGNEQVRVRRASDDAIILTTTDSQFSFNTDANGIYVIERTSAPLITFKAARITGFANQGVKYLAGTKSALGSAVAGRYEAEAAMKIGTVAVTPDAAASNGAEVTHFSAAYDALMFNNVAAGNRLSIGYCTTRNPGSLSLYINGTKVRTVTFPSTKSSSGVYKVVKLELNIPGNATVKLQMDSGDKGANIDYIQVHGGK